MVITIKKEVTFHGVACVTIKILISLNVLSHFSFIIVSPSGKSL